MALSRKVKIGKPVNYVKPVVRRTAPRRPVDVALNATVRVTDPRVTPGVLAEAVRVALEAETLCCQQRNLW